MLSAKTIEPGKSGEIEASMKTEGVTGKVTKTVTVKSNDPKQPELILNLTALVEPEFTLSERSLYFGSVNRGKEVVKQMTITIPADKPLKLVSAESTDQSVTVKMEPVPGTSGKVFRIVATQKADAKEGYHFGNLVIKTTSSLAPELKIPVRGMITAGQ